MNRKTICIATPDIIGPIRNGGIGTACFEIAKTWKSLGHDVTVLYVNEGYCETSEDHWIDIYRDLDITFVSCPRAEQTGVPPVLQRPWDAWQWLKTRHFDLVYFPEWRATGLYAVQAKKSGVGFPRTLMIVGLHSPVNWHSTGGMHFPSGMEEVVIDSAERQTVAFADIVISPSQYMIDYMRGQDWKLPGDVRVIPNPFPALPPSPLSVSGATVDEVVFFGRLERRKGLLIFLSALGQLPKDIRARLKITFLGKKGYQAERAGQLIAEEGRRLGYRKWQVIDTYNSNEALAYLQSPGRLAVMASLTENSPMTVRECIALGIPFLASNVGGIPELIAEAAHEEVLFAPEPADLAASIQRAVRTGAGAAPCAFQEEAVTAAWRGVADIDHLPDAGLPATYIPKVSVVVTTFNRPLALGEALQGLREQSWQPLEVVLVDDGSTDPEAIEMLDRLEPEFRRRGWQMIRQVNRYLGAARNAGWRAATGDFVIFHDDDNHSPPDLAETYVRALQRSNADIATCTMAPFQGNRPAGSSRQSERVYPFIGNATGIGLYLNLFGDAHACFRRSALQVTGGFTEDYGIGHEDWEIFARASLMGLQIIYVPEPLFWYRESENSMLRSRSFVDPDYMRSLRPYLDAVPGTLRPGLQFALSTTVPVAPPLAEPATPPTLALSPSSQPEPHSVRPAYALRADVTEVLLSRSILPARLRNERALRRAAHGELSWIKAIRPRRFSLTELASLRRLNRLGPRASETMDVSALAVAALPRQLRSPDRLLDLASFRQSWQRVAYRHPFKISYWLTVRSLQRFVRKVIWKSDH